MEGKCLVCGAPMENGVCGYCGYKKEEAAPIQPNANQQSSAPQPQIIINNQNVVTNGIIAGVSRKNKTTALLLRIFLGIFGIHRFYVGKIGTGLVYMFTGGLFGIGWIIDTSSSNFSHFSVRSFQKKTCQSKQSSSVMTGTSFFVVYNLGFFLLFQF